MFKDADNVIFKCFQQIFPLCSLWIGYLFLSVLLPDGLYTPGKFLTLGRYFMNIG